MYSKFHTRTNILLFGHSQKHNLTFKQTNLLSFQTLIFRFSKRVPKDWEVEQAVSKLHGIQSFSKELLVPIRAYLCVKIAKPSLNIRTRLVFFI